VELEKGMKKFILASAMIFLVFILGLIGCTGSTSNPSGSPVTSNLPSDSTASANSSTSGKGPITVGSKIDTEGGLLAQIIILMLQKNGFQIGDKSQLGPTQVVREALLNGQIDIYPEYTGNGAIFFPNVDPGVWENAQKGFQTVKQQDQEHNDIIWLQPAPANNTWAIALPKSLSEKENIRSLTDFADYVNKGGTVKLAASDEFVTSAAALPTFETAYGFTLNQKQLLTFSGGNTAQTEKAAADGTSGVNAAMAYGTDGSLAALNLVVLTDPKGVQPVYEPAPIVRGAVYKKYPEMANILDPVFQTLDLTTLQTLNSQIALQGLTAVDVARQYLTSKGFLK
jgi:osmoprotectant transport system substrate-binding protein